MKSQFSQPRLGMNRFVVRFGALSGAKALGLVFFAGFLVRLVPELLAFPLPIGFDTVYYATVMKSGVVWANWGSVFTSTWLLHAFTVPLYSLTQVDPFLLLKIVAPSLYGLSVAGVYWFGRKMLGWEAKICLAAVAIFAVQLASLRISWDLLRNTLGMGLLLFALPFVSRLDSKRGFAGFMVLSLLTVFAHEYAAVTLVFIVLGLLVWHAVKGRLGRVDMRIVLAALPALLVFSTGMFLRVFPISFGASVSNVVSTGEASSGRFLFMANYLAVNDAYYYYPSYWNLVLDVAVLLAFLYLPYLFLVWKGYFRNSVLNLWLGLLLVGSFSCLVWPFAAIENWDRCMFMLVYPFTFFAANGLFRFLRSSSEARRLLGRVSKVAVLGGLALTVTLGCVYLATPALMAVSSVGVWAAPIVSAYFSSAPTVPYQDVNGVVQAMKWLDANTASNSCVVLNYVLEPWGQLDLDGSHVMVEFWNDTNAAVSVALSRGFSSLYLVWWNVDNGWYHVSVPSSFVRLEDFGRISVYDYGDGNVGRS